MWDFLHGEIGLAPAVARGLGFDEVDFYYQGYEVRRQKALEGHRQTAFIIYRALGGEDSTPADFMRLPAVDGPKRVVLSALGETVQEMAARLAEENRKKQLAKQMATP